MTKFGNWSRSFDRYLDEIDRYPMMDRDHEKEVGERAFEGDTEARQQLVQANLRFAVNVAKKYRGRGVPFEDLIQAANKGLVIAAAKFDPGRGVKFISMAVWWIRANIMEVLAKQGSAVKIPQHAHSELMRIARAKSEILDREGRPATSEEIAEHAKVTPSQMKHLAPLRTPTLRLDAPINEDTDSGWLGVLDTETRVEPTESVEDGRTQDAVMSALDAVEDPRDAVVLMLRHGIGTEGDGLTLLNIGFLLGVTRERVRQLQRRAEERLADNPDLHPYAEGRKAA